MYKIITLSLSILIIQSLSGQASVRPADTTQHAKPADTTQRARPAEWFRKISLRGYTQIRYNQLLETNPNLKNEAGDRSWGGTGGISIRRARMIFFGQVSERVYIYLQTDMASQVNSSINNIHFMQIRDCYFDLSLDKKSEYRLRFGQSKVPFGFENMQSSQNRLALDRSDAINSGAPNERDMGVFGYWAPVKIRERFAFLSNSAYKGSGDYGVVGIGLYNGQTTNRNEANNNMHMVAHITYPFLVRDKQYIEVSAHAYHGIFTVTKNAKTKGSTNFTDQRFCGSLVIYPQPFGFQVEYNVGKGPEFNTADSSIRLKNMDGGYALIMYRKTYKKQQITPFARYHFYNGGKKAEIDALSYTVNDMEIGLEWLPIPNFELTLDYTLSRRRFEDFDKPVNAQAGRLLRVQAQFNF
jgi:hypothetical protein